MKPSCVFVFLLGVVDLAVFLFAPPAVGPPQLSLWVDSDQVDYFSLIYHDAAVRSADLCRVFQSKKKGLSRDDKRVKMLEIFHEKKEPFAIPDLEPYAKKKGVVVQSVKEIVCELADDGEVSFDKIGVTTYYWSFPSQIGHMKRLKIEELASTVAKNKKLLTDLEADRKRLQAERQVSAQRTERLERMAALKSQVATLQQELRLYADNDPEVLNALAQDAREAAEAANRWADNISMMRSYITKQVMMSCDEFNKQFSLPDDFEDVNPAL